MGATTRLPRDNERQRRVQISLITLQGLTYQSSLCGISLGDRRTTLRRKPLDLAMMTTAIFTLALQAWQRAYCRLAAPLVWTRRPCCASSNFEPK